MPGAAEVLVEPYVVADSIITGDQEADCVHQTELRPVMPAEILDRFRVEFARHPNNLKLFSIPEEIQGPFFSPRRR